MLAVAEKCEVADDRTAGGPGQTAPGKLHLFLGVAPGAGKTYAMLAEGRRRAAQGEDVVIGLMQAHRRPDTAARPAAWR